MRKKAIGHWASLFGERRSFFTEIERAVEISAEWTCSKYRRDIVLDEIPGWFPPLWGSDQGWMYLRRPEGVWKTRIPEGFPCGERARLYQRKTLADGSSRIMGGMAISNPLAGHSGWVCGVDKDHPLEAADIDHLLSPESRGISLDADKLLWELGALVTNSPGKILVRAEALFQSAPRFRVKGDWLFAQDSTSGYVVAYSLDRTMFKDALGEGRLWMRFDDGWIEPFEVRVATQE